MRHLEWVQDEFALPSRNAAPSFVVNRDLKTHGSQRRTEAERKAK
jgi:hypothetical protein